MKRVIILTAVLCLVALVAAGEAGSENTEARVQNAGPVDRQSAVVGQRSPVVGGADAISIPQMLSYQGRLTDTLWVPVADTVYAVRFRLYAQPTGGTQFWEEDQQVRTEEGLFSVLLGAVTPIGSVPDAGAAYLGMAVAGGAELTPRLRIASAAYAYLSARAANADLLQGKDTTGFVRAGQANSVTSAMIANGTIAAADLGQMGASSGQVMKWTGSAWAPRNDSTGGGGVSDSAWVRGTPDSVLFTIRQLGIARGGAANELFGTNRHTHSNFGSACTTGASGLNRPYCTVGGGLGNVASGAYAVVAAGAVSKATGPWSAVLGGQDNTASGTHSAVSGGRDNAADGGGSVVAGGVFDSAFGLNSTIGGGSTNKTSAIYATVSGGYSNRALAHAGGILSGMYNLAGDAAGDTAAVVAGGYNNAAIGMFSSVGGGQDNTADSVAATVGGGMNNTATNGFAAVAGGNHNNAGGQFSSVAGGNYNDATGQFSTVGGGNFNDATGQFAVIGGGDYNVASGHGAVVAGGSTDSARAPYSAALSGFHNLSGEYSIDTASVIAGGWDNEVSGRYSTIGGGAYNNVDAYYATVAGGDSNRAWGECSGVGGGRYNWTDGRYGTIAGGDSNRNIDCDYGAIGGGYRNSVEDADYGTVSGGRFNDVSAGYGTVGGGLYNLVDDQYGTIAGGDSNHAEGPHSAIGGGGLNWVDNNAGYGTVDGGRADSVRALYGTAGSGYSNLVGDAADDTATVIAGGWNNTATGKFNFLGGGYQNNSSNNYSVVVGGRGNTANGPQASIGGGWGNTASGWHSAIAGGLDNTASGTSSTVSGGEDNLAGAIGATAVGGRNDTCAGDYALVSGYNVRARAGADYSLAFGENCSTSVSRAVVFYHSGAATKLGVGVQTPTHYIDVTGGSYCDASGWHNPSSRELKRDIAKLTPAECRAVLQQLLATDVARYKYKSDEHGQEHIGLIAEEAPGVLTGPEHKAIGTGDAIGFLMAAVKAQQAEIEQLKAELKRR